MAEFAISAKELNSARREQADAKSALDRARERRASLDRDIERLRRVANAADGALTQRLAALETERADLDAQIAQLHAKLAQAATAHLDKLAQFGQFSDPASAIEQLSDDAPIALFPLRLETRFKAVPDGAQTRHELWVRAFPDDVLVDTFQPDLSEVEVRNARVYWTHIWRAGGDEAGRMAAWRALVKSHGAGRAKWIVDSYAPLRPELEPLAAENKHILVILPETPVDSGEHSAIAAFWSDVWQSAGGARARALADLEVALTSAARAAEVAERLVPVNLHDVAVRPDPELEVEVAFLDLPDPLAQPTTAAPWARGARTSLLPERLVVMGFNGGVETIRAVGAQIPSELQVGPDPSLPEDEQLRADGEDLAIPAALRWTVDFDEAVKVGMGFVVELTQEQASTGFDSLIVAGVRLSSDAEDGAQQLENLISHHLRSRKGFTVLPQGTATNNTDAAASDYTWWEDPDASYRHFFTRDHADDPDGWRVRYDGAWLAGMLGVDRELLKASPSYFGSDQSEARAMNIALWPATLGYFMEQMMAPVFSDGAIEETRDFFNRFVIGRGTTPAIRIGRQPYGVLPTTVHSRADWFNTSQYSRAARTKDLPSIGFLRRLRAGLDRAAIVWDGLIVRVASVGEGGPDPQQRLLDIVGLHPTSVELHQRYAESFEELYNRLGFSNVLTKPAADLARSAVEAGLKTLAQLGWVRDVDDLPPEILSKFFLRRPNLLKGTLVDLEHSDSAPLSVARADGDNYLAWLQQAARTSHDTLRRQDGFDDGPPTDAAVPHAPSRARPRLHRDELLPPPRCRRS